MRELYIFYRVAEAELATVTTAVGGLQAALCLAHPALQVKLLRRPELSEGRVTLMEVYARPGQGGVDLALQAEIEARAAVLAPWLQAPRRVEVFEPCA